MTLSRRWALILGLLLALSLAMNFFVGGLVAGRAMGFKTGPFSGQIGGGQLLQFTLKRIAKALPADERPILRQTLRSHRATIEARLAGLRDARLVVAESLRQEPFQPAQLNVALAELRSSQAALQEGIMTALAEAAGKLSPEGRRALAEWGDRSR
ncbi:MAG: periplasmic heavy metal sensor [Alphaproteobacteria bacterium]|nr:periplasmic heavy metal sensor [Alphaproteobacteria bacterium]